MTECYSSPVLAARPGSSHGYDICDHNRLNPELGSEQDFEAFAQSLSNHNLGLVLDFVPNHMSADTKCNSWWRNVLEHGPASPFARFFDINWESSKSELKGKLLLPILGAQYGQVLENLELQIDFSEGRFSLRHFDRNLPLNLRQMRPLLRHNLQLLQSELADSDPNLQEFLSILFQLDNIPVAAEHDSARTYDGERELEIARERLARLVQSSEQIKAHLETNLRLVNGGDDLSPDFDLLHSLLEGQAYRLSYWRTASHEINYRRFFDINELVGLRMEDPLVFDAAHPLLLRLLHRGLVTGVRLDHVDGLADPAEYFNRLIEAAGIASFYLVVEKILSQGETLPNSWNVHGTTGYDFLNDLNGVFVDGRNAQKIRSHYERFIGEKQLFSDVVYNSKKLIIKTSMASELNMLAYEINRMSEVDWRYRDFTLDSLKQTLREVVSCFPVYRTYVSEAGWAEFDQQQVDIAVARALRRNPAVEPSIYVFIREMLIPIRDDRTTDDQLEKRLRFSMKFQQYTGPIQAKGVEDTAFYRYAPLLSLNEVGGDPLRFGRTVDEFHNANRDRLASWPLSILATATHDTKRGEDARARVNVLSELPDEYRTELSQWARINAGKRTITHGQPAPDRRDEYLFYQALLGAWPASGDFQPDATFVQRLQEYMWKAIREAKIHTSWINPNETYDTAVGEFVKRTLQDRRFLTTFEPFARRVAVHGMLNSLAQVVLKIGSPGVPDFYQGTELWDLNLVDPDNRRPVDYELRRQLLSELMPLLDQPGACKKDRVAELLQQWQTGQIKLYVTAAGLRLRRAAPALFLTGDYLPLDVEGAKREHVVGFARRLGSKVVLVIAPRLTVALTEANGALPIGADVWEDTALVGLGALASNEFRNIFTGARLPVGDRLPISDALGVCPVAIWIAGPPR